MWRVVSKLGLLIAFFVLAHWHVWPDIANGQINGSLVLFANIWLLTLLSVALLSLHASFAVRAVFAVLLTWSAGNALSYFYITGFALNAIEVERLFQDIAFIDETFEFYGAFILRASLLSALIFVAFLLPAPKTSARLSSWINASPWLLALPILGVSYVVYQDGGGDSDQLPLPVSPIGFVVVLGYDEVMNNPEVAREIPAVTTQDSGLQKIVVIMDESVRGDYLDLNLSDGVPSGLLPYLDKGANFGIAASFANCSAASNASFRYLARRDSFIEDLKIRPSIWAMAKHAGYKTVYLDGQRTNRELQNFMTAQELSEIDELIQHDDKTNAVDKDMVLVGMLNALLQRDEKLFIYVNKSGVHFPYESKYPRDATLYTPHMEGKGINVNEGNAYGNEFGNEAFKNSYRNAVAWNTGEFFKRLMPMQDLRQTLLIYTSDHGQNFSKTQEQGFLTHCTTGPAPAPEGSVPLVMLTENAIWRDRVKIAAQENRQVSHWDLPPTVLLALGYPEFYVSEHYAPSVFADQVGKAEFVSTFFVRFGLEPVWNKPLPRNE